MRASPYATFSTHPVRGIFGVLAWPRTYTNLVYLLIGFPLGLAYFVLYVVLGSLGVGLAILAIGLGILFLLVIAAWALAHVERWLANALLGADVPAPPPTAIREGGWPWVRSVFSNPVTWKGLAFQLVKFPLGLASWIIAIVVLSVVVGFIAAPAIVGLGGTMGIEPWWAAETVREAWLFSVVGLLAVVPALHLLNGLAWLWAAFARVMLGGRAPREPNAGGAWAGAPGAEPLPAV